MGCRRASSSTLLMAVVAISLLLTLAHARHVRSPSSTSTGGERPSTEDDDQVWQGTSSRKLGAEEHTKNTATVHAEKGAAGGRSSNSPASSAEKVVVARYGPRPHPKKHN